jgi:hypothetical protein
LKRIGNFERFGLKGGGGIGCGKMGARLRIKNGIGQKNKRSDLFDVGEKWGFWLELDENVQKNWFILIVLVYFWGKDLEK